MEKKHAWGGTQDAQTISQGVRAGLISVAHLPPVAGERRMPGGKVSSFEELLEEPLDLVDDEGPPRGGGTGSAGMACAGCSVVETGLAWGFGGVGTKYQCICGMETSSTHCWLPSFFHSSSTMAQT